MQTHRPCPRPMEAESVLEQDPPGESHAHSGLASSRPIFPCLGCLLSKEPTMNARAFIWIVTSFSLIFSPFTELHQQYYGLLTLDRNRGRVVEGRKKGWNILYETRYKTSHQDRAWSGLHEWLDHGSIGMKTGPLVPFLNRKRCGRGSIGGGP